MTYLSPSLAITLAMNEIYLNNGVLKKRIKALIHAYSIHNIFMLTALLANTFSLYIVAGLIVTPRRINRRAMVA